MNKNDLVFYPNEIICDKECHDVRTVLSRVYDVDYEVYFYILENKFNNIEIQKCSIVEENFYKV